MKGKDEVTHILVCADTLDKENAELGLPLADVLHQELPTLEGAVGGIENAHGASAVEKVVEKFIEGLERDLLPQAGGTLVLGVEEFGRLVHGLAQLLRGGGSAIEIQLGGLVLHDYVGGRGAVEENGGGSGG